MPAAGDRLAGYLIEDALGEGGMGVVFRARRVADGAAVALKVMRADLASDERHRRRFRREARAAAEVRHPHLVGLIETGEADGHWFIAMRLVDGMTLRQRIGAQGPLAVADLVQLALEVAAGLEALHDAGIVHRDVKPSNILIDSRGSAALADFGLARADRYSAITEPGQVLGTLDYIAPELIRGEEPSPASDLYGLGCVLFEGLTGAPPFGGRSFFEVGMGHLEDQPPDPRARRPELPRAVAETVLAALAKDPGERPPTASAFARELAVSEP
jgi:serine/threonine protein kinase